MSKIISIINYKGGVGKTTLTLNLALSLASLYQKKILLFDLDPQCSLSISCLHEADWIEHIEKKGSISSIIQSYYLGDIQLIDRWLTPILQSNNIYLLPSHLNLPEYEMKLVSHKPLYLTSDEFEYNRFFILNQALKKISDQFDFVFLDCPPNIYMISRNAILSSDYYIIPTIPDYLSSFGIPFIHHHIQNFIENHNFRKIQFLGIILNKVKLQKGEMVKEHKIEFLNLKEKFNNLVWKNYISDRILITTTMRRKINIFEDSSKKYQTIKQEYQNLINEFLEKINS